MSNFRGLMVEDKSIPSGASFGVVKGSTHLPPGAVRLTRDQMQSIMDKMVSDWVPQREMNPLKYGDMVESLAAGSSGLVFNSFFRRCFKVGVRHKLVSMGPTVVIPAMTACILQRLMVATPIMLNELDCPVCAETRAVSLQVATGFLQPLVMGFLTCAIIAKNEFTVKVPPLTDIRQIAELFRKFTRPALPSFAALLALNVFTASYVTYRQGKCVAQIREKMLGPSNLETLQDS